MSLFDILGIDPDNLKGMGDWLQAHYIENKSEVARMCHARLLDEFYAGGGDDEMKAVIDKMYRDPKNRERRNAVIDAELDKYDNIIERIVNDTATVYSEPARRKIQDADEVYQAFLELVEMDEAMAQLDRMLALHTNALLWYRVRVTPTGQREPLLEVVSPASFWAVHHPNDRTMLVAIIFDQRMALAPVEAPAFRVWTNDQTFMMNGKCQIFPTSVESWPLGQMPGVLASVVKPGSKPTLLTQFPNRALLSGQKAIRLQAINLAKESISAVNQTYITGDVSATTMGQTSDSESDVLLGEGVTASTLNRGMDQSEFRDNGSYVADTVANNYGLPPSVRQNKDATSGAEIELRRIPIREIRKKRIPIMRRIERAIVAIIAQVNRARVTMGEDDEPVLVAGDLPEFAFNADGWSIDFGEVQQPMSAAEQDAVYETRKRLQLTDAYEEEMRRNPDIKTLDEAKKIVDDRIKRNTEFVQSQKDLMAASGALGAMQPATPFQVNRGVPQQDPALQVVK